MGFFPLVLIEIFIVSCKYFKIVLFSFVCFRIMMHVRMYCEILFILNVGFT